MFKKLFVLLTLVVLLSSCSRMMMAMLKVKKPVLYENHLATYDKIEKNIKPRNLNYLQVFEDSTTSTSKDSIKTKFTMSSYVTPEIFNSEGHKLYFDTIQYPSCTNQPHKVITEYNVPIDSLQAIDSMRMEDKLKSFRDVYGQAVVVPPVYDYYVFLNWSTYLIGPQEKNLDALDEKINKKKVFYIFVNRDFYKEFAIKQGLE